VWNLVRKEFIKPEEVRMWSVINFCAKRRLSEQDVNEYTDAPVEALKLTGGGGATMMMVVMLIMMVTMVVVLWSLVFPSLRAVTRAESWVVTTL
jgi:hypothetical protein